MIFRPALNFEDGMSLKGPPSSFSPLKLRGSIINTKLDEKEAEKTFRTNRKWSEFVKGEREGGAGSFLVRTWN